ncbi:tRNA pseudouridine(38-40) synthase TruA [Algoriphagus boritolerans]|uniref:tRNA pseudouridine synthase A n=2 Tax=Algoriphagus TaxID=246875 RepID=A0A1H5VWS7_9BACT|nr:tRNA pseudouridine(38-40) synthase TruA [Algoriphagus boritolerans]SEF91017.1 tRNA pseudouridine38-40 synthase [Algoriphagus boritolerans DSM 17298 = JCM 18970]
MSETKRYFLELSYKGTPFHGWQIQKNAFTVQECLESALGTYFRRPIFVVGSGRTDTGVHAFMQVCHFDLEENMLPGENFLKAINSILPKEISIHSIRPVKQDAHARFSARKRAYVYRIIFRKNPFLNELAWHCFTNPDVEKMNEAAQALLRHEDFECFSKVHTDVKHFRCEIISAYWEQKDHQLLFHISANRFLRGMVRAIVGTLMEVGLGMRNVESMDELIRSRDRALAGKAAPAKGLFLSQIVYKEDIYLD